MIFPKLLQSKDQMLMLMIRPASLPSTWPGASHHLLKDSVVTVSPLLRMTCCTLRWFHAKMLFFSPVEWLVTHDSQNGAEGVHTLPLRFTYPSFISPEGKKVCRFTITLFQSGDRQKPLPHVFATCLKSLYANYTVDTCDWYHNVKVVKMNCLLLLSHVTAQNTLLHKQSVSGLCAPALTWPAKLRLIVRVKWFVSYDL